MKIINKKIARKSYSQTCKICNREIKGTSISAVEYNMALHIQAHRKREDKK